MNRSATSSDDLLDFHFGRLMPEEAARIQHEIESDGLMAARSRKLSGWLDLLKSYESPPPPPGLVDAIMNRISQAPSLRLAAAAPSLPPATDGAARRPIVSLREFVALAACITFLVSVVVPGFAKVRSVSQRNLCAANMAGIYQGLGQYAAAFNGNLPQTAGFVPGANWWARSPAPGVQPIPNRRNLFLVVRMGYAKPGHFICPSAGGPPKRSSIPLEKMDDFSSPAHCGFDFQNMAGPTLPLGHGGLQAILADRNPLFDGDNHPKVLSPEINSYSHGGGAGQNVLSSDGRIEWLTSPRVGPHRDNIWQVEGVERYTGSEFQRRPDDAFLVP